MVLSNFFSGKESSNLKNAPEGTPRTSPLRVENHSAQLSAPTAAVILLRHTLALHSVALRFPGFGGVSQENRATPPQKGPVAPTFSALEGGVARQVVAWKVSRHRARSQLHCCLARYNGPPSCTKLCLSCATIATE